MDIILSDSESISPPRRPAFAGSGSTHPGPVARAWKARGCPAGFRCAERALPALRVHRSPLPLGASPAFPPPRPSAGNRVAIPTTGPDREVISRVSAEAWRMERLPPVGGVNVKRPTPSSAWGSGSMGVRQPGRSVGVAVAITRRYRNWSRLLRRPDFRHLPRHNGSLCLPPRPW